MRKTVSTGEPASCLLHDSERVWAQVLIVGAILALGKRTVTAVLRIMGLSQGLLVRIRPYLTVKYLVVDGHFGNHNAVLMARRLGVPLISTLRSDSALYYPYDGPYAGRGPRRIYGERIDPTAIPERFLTQTTVEDGLETRIYQIEARHETFDQPLNVVVIVTRHQTSGKQAHVYLFSSDRTLAWDCSA